MKYLLFFIWIELIILFASGCETSPRPLRGDWMEHLNYKQFNFIPLNSWRRHNYYSEEELRQMWNEVYNDMLERQEKKEIESLHKWSD